MAGDGPSGGLFGPLVSRTRPWLLERVLEGTETVAAVQRLCGVPPPDPTGKRASNRGYWPLHILFTAGAACGNELWYITMLPFLFWQGDEHMARQVILLWSCSYYVGQGMKDLWMLPRPAHGRGGVNRLEAHYEAEYGLPSTHAMAAVSMPWTVVWNAFLRWDVAPEWEWAPYAAAATWTILMTLSRLYMGVHSNTDIIVGAILGLLSLATVVTLGPAADAIMLALPFTPLLLPVVTMVLSVLYPRPAKWVNSPGDTILIIAVMTGVTIASWLRHHEVYAAAMGDTAAAVVSGALALVGEAGDASAPVPLPIVQFDFSPTRVLPRVLVGYAVLFATRAVLKSLGMAVLTALLPKSDVEPKRRYAIELPVKYLTYGAVGFNAVYTVPLLFDYLGLARHGP